MKSIIIALTLIVAVSCGRVNYRGLKRDVSEIVKGDGWYKDESGYHYNEPETRFDAPAPEEPAPAPADEPAPAPADEPAPAPEVVADEVVPEEPVVADEPVEVVVADEPAPVVEVVEVVEVPLERGYLPPRDEAKKKRQIPVRRQVRKVYRRYVKKH